MKQEKLTGWLLIAGAASVLIPYTILTLTFHYPDILREESSVILTEFYKGGPALIFTWLAFALLGLPMLVAYSLLGQQLEVRFSHTRWITTLGIVSGIVQVVGLLRWVFVVPLLATEFVTTENPATKAAIEVSFKVVHQFGGVLLGEHVGQLFAILWTVCMSYFLVKGRIIQNWLGWFGYLTSAIYFAAQAELLATVIPSFPSVPAAGFLGSTLWLAWMILLGVTLIRKGNDTHKEQELPNHLFKTLLKSQ